jgi:aerobic-type carbon monoxide dehydrogenase small subunit (CoxS/CutS family)
MPPLVLRVNGQEHRLDVPRRQPLLTTLRESLGLTGTKYGCGEGQCGACTVMVDGKPARSCRTDTAAVAGKNITTIEGLAYGAELHPLQAAFLKHEAFQCGYCTPGMIVSAAALLNANPHPSDEEIVRQMNGNVCRCGTYSRVMAAIREVAGGGKK